MKLYGGIDLHSNNSVLAVLDEEERLVYRRHLPNEAGAVLEALAPYREALVGVVVESTYTEGRGQLLTCAFLAVFPRERSTRQQKSGRS